MTWTVLLEDNFAEELLALDEALQDELLAHAKLLAQFGPGLGRPTVDTLKGSAHANMKEMRFNWVGQVWRVAFAFDQHRQAVFLAGGDKAGVDQRRFYKKLIVVADARYSAYLRSFNEDQLTRGSPHGKKTR
jgi:hypothetical protein